MDSGCSGNWSAECAQDLVTHRAQRAEVAALHADAAALRRQAAALRRFARESMVTIEIGTAPSDATTADLVLYAGQLRAAIAETRRSLERQVCAAVTRRFRRNLPPVDSHERRRSTATLQIGKARQALADDLGRCDPADFGRLERLALALDESGLPGVRSLLRAIAGSVDSMQRSRQAAISRARIGVLVADVLPQERGTLLELLGSVPDPDLPTLANRAQAAVARADRHRAMAGAAGCEFDSGVTGTGLAALSASHAAE